MRCSHTCWQQVAGQRKGTIVVPLIKSKNMREFSFSYRRFPAYNPTYAPWFGSLFGPSSTSISNSRRATEKGPFPWNPNTSIPAPMVAVTSWT